MKQQIDILNLTVEHLRVLASSACGDVMSAFHAYRPMSAREAGEAIERSPASVLEQVQKLLEVGLLIEAGTRKRRSRTEQLYLPAARVIRFEMAGQPPEVLDAYMDRVRGRLKQTERNFAKLLELLPEDQALLDFLIYKTYTLRVDREQALRIKIVTGELMELLRTYAKDDAEAADSQNAVRLNVTVFGLPTFDELRKRSKKE